ncbi:preprotein translocase subunit SecA (ATPase, RNA helicase) [Burkholderiales bacterium JOSHI_001]|nr:preprotein translocase subunit SecA (ATPase, RNA helicase) [Burkholderiales bacterium JOSHI_001]
MPRIDLVHTVPVPGPLWGLFPRRPDTPQPPPRRAWAWHSASQQCRSLAGAAEGLAHQFKAQGLVAEQRRALAAQLGTALRRQGFCDAALAPALGLAAATAADLLGQPPFATQLFCAAALLHNRLAEMATGEGKTLATALAAATAALAGVPVHVVTANDYLAERDALRLAPLYQALGLQVAFLRPGDGPQAKQATYAASVVYATAKELAFDHLRDQLALAGGPSKDLQRHAAALAGDSPAPLPVMRGLCMALLDEADSILLDEADVPLILSRSVPHAARRAFLWQALALARQLVADTDFKLHEADRRAELTPAGEARVGGLAAPLGGPWQRARYRREAITVALTGLHLLRRDHHYIMRAGQGRERSIELLDEVTGRVAEGRVWSRGLQAVVEMKEGLPPGADTETLARTTFQRFFQRYWRLAGTSGTLWEARGELQRVFAASVVRVPLQQPSQRRRDSDAVFADAPRLWAAVALRTRELCAAGRPVLIGTDSVADSQALSAVLRAHGIEHQVLNALNDADEAAIVAQAGHAARVTISTRMAGRGTDIELDAAARAAGGLHVLNCQHNPSRRLDRQLVGRCARQGDPGSAQAWWMARNPMSQVGVLAPILAACHRHVRIEETPWVRPQWVLRLMKFAPQWGEEHQRAGQRAALLQSDLQWQRRLAFAGREN